ncbi:hypothetical protein J4N39_08940 [Vibrio sp. SCSIO 43136]|nr:hypothetical protein J4N39_08940 [Vibrio sp. SCSIO 43136]
MLQGLESTLRLELVISLSSIRSDGQKMALHKHFVDGLNFSASAAIAEITESNFQRAIDRVQEIDTTIEAIKEHDWARFKSEK